MALLNGVNHIAILTADADRFIRFYQEVFDARVVRDNPRHAGQEGERMVVMTLGGTAELNAFQITGNIQPSVQTPMFGRGRLDHFGLNASSPEAFEDIRQRLIKTGASDGTINNFGTTQSVFFRDPDGLEAEVLLPAEQR